jgi:predicted nucleic acid-binding protein
MSLTVMRKHAIADALALDGHFAEAGFTPAP